MELTNRKLRLTTSKVRWGSAVLGILFTHIGEVLAKSEVFASKSVWISAIPKTAIELGIGFIVAAVVSWIFDFAYHRLTFAEPVQEIEKNMRELFTTVGQFNQVLRAAQQNHVAALYRRHSEAEKLAWIKAHRTLLDEASQTVRIVARSLDSLLPDKKRHWGIGTSLEKALERGVTVQIVLANTFDPDAAFRVECERRQAGSSYVLYMPTRDTVRQLLEISAKLNDPTNLQLRLLREPPPYAMFMVRQKAIVEPYLPYVEGGEGIVFEIQPNDSTRFRPSEIDPPQSCVFDAYEQSYDKLFEHAEPVTTVIARWKARQNTGDLKKSSRYDTMYKLALRIEGKPGEAEPKPPPHETAPEPAHITDGHLH